MAYVRFFLCQAAFFPGVSLAGSRPGRPGLLPQGYLREMLLYCWQRRLMKGTLNQDTEHHESCQQLSWRGGIGPSVAAYEWLTDSCCFPHEQQKCEEVVKISAASSPRIPESCLSQDKQTRMHFVPHSSLWQSAKLNAGIFFFFGLFCFLLL